MHIPDENKWSRFHSLRESLSGLPVSELRTRIERLKEEGEPGSIISLLELHYRLARSPELPPGRRLANHYTIRRRIGEGGMGVVYSAVQDLTHQEVAIKVIHPALVCPSLIARFREEISTLGKLQHEHIVRVFDADQDRDEVYDHDLLFYAMQLVEGDSLARWVAESQPSIEERLDCFVRICDAVDYAHSCGVIHRDLKPDNILVNARGQPAILDFGLARVADAAFELPREEALSEGKTVLQVSGTPGYLSAERWDGHQGGVPADVFALGVILHEMLTGARPWRPGKDEPINELRRAIRNFSPRQLRHQRTLGRDLSALIGAMLDPDPEKRPTSVAVVAHRVRRALSRRRLLRRVRRSAPVWGSLLVATVSVLVTQRYYQHREGVMNESRARLRQAENVLRMSGRIDKLERVASLLPKDPRHRHSQDEWRDAVIAAMSGWNLRWTNTVVLPDGFQPMEADGAGARFFGRWSDGRWGLLQPGVDDRATKEYGGSDEVARARFHPEQAEMVLLEQTGRLIRWNPDSGDETAFFEEATPDSLMEFSPDGHHFAVTVLTGSRDPFDIEPVGEIHVFHTRSWERLRVLAGRGEESCEFVHFRTREINGLEFSPDGVFLAAWSHGSSRVPVWRVEDGSLVRLLDLSDPVASAAWRPRGEEAELALITGHGLLRSWIVRAGPELLCGDEPSGAFRGSTKVGVGASQRERGVSTPDDFAGRLLWIPSGEGLIAVYESPQEMEFFPVNKGADSFHRPLSAQYMETVDWVSGGRVRQTVSGLVWEQPELESPIWRTTERADYGDAELGFSPDGRVLMASENSKVTFLDAGGMGVVGQVTDIAINPPAWFAPDGDLWAYGKNDGLLIWHVTEVDGELRLKPARPKGFRGVGRLAVAGSHYALSKGQTVFVREHGQTINQRVAEDEGDFHLRAELRVGDEFALADDGRVVAVIRQEASPLASVWYRDGAGAWLQRSYTNGPVLDGLYDWNGTNWIALADRLLRTAEEARLQPGPSHWPAATRLVAARDRPVVVSALAPDAMDAPEYPIHVDYLAVSHCVHIALIPLGTDSSGSIRELAVSSDGALVAAIVKHRGVIHLCDLRRLFDRLREWQLGVPEFELGSPDTRPPLRAVREVRN